MTNLTLIYKDWIRSLFKLILIYFLTMIILRLHKLIGATF